MQKIFCVFLLSHPARGAWIEIREVLCDRIAEYRRTPQGVRGLKLPGDGASDPGRKSHPARGAWIEMIAFCMACVVGIVAPRKGCVD